MAQYGDITRDVKTRTIGEPQIRVARSAPYIANAAPALNIMNSIGALASAAVNETKEYYEFKSGTPSTVDGTVVLSNTFQIDAAFLEKKPSILAIASGIDPYADVPAAVSLIGSMTSAGTTTGTITANDNGSVDDTFMVVFTGAAAGDIYGTASGLVHTFTDLTTSMAPDNGGNPYFTIPANYFSGTWAAGETYTFRTTPFLTGSAAYGNNYAGEIPIGKGEASAYFRVEAVVAFPKASHQMIFVIPRAEIVSSLTMDFPEGGEGSLPVVFKATKATSVVEGGHAVWDNDPLGKVVFV